MSALTISASARTAGEPSRAAVPGRRRGPGKDFRLPRKALLDLLANLATLLENGLSLPKSLAIVAGEKSLRRHAAFFEALKARVESGESFSTALAAYPRTFDRIMVHEVRTAEQAGTAAATLGEIAIRLETQNELRNNILKKLSYPALVFLAGIASVVTMMLVVVPQFEQTFSRSGIPLPLSTTILMTSSAVAKSYGWILVPTVALAAWGLARARRSPKIALALDRFLLGLPVAGTMLRDFALLQFVGVLSRMLNSGFRLAEALAIAADGMSNRVMREAVEDLRVRVARGEKLSAVLHRHRTLFPSIFSQLVIVGEQAGTLPKTLRAIQTSLAKQAERMIDRFVAFIEPAMTLGMVAAIGLIMLAIYEPMFAMMETMK